MHTEIKLDTTWNKYLSDYLTFTTLWDNSADDKLMIGFVISCKLSQMEAICMKSQNLFSGENKKIIIKCRLLKCLPRVLSFN